MSDLTDLYQEIILDHGKRPRNFRHIEKPDRQAEGFNPLCGDRVTVQFNVREGAISEMAFTGSGCAICMASASLMTETLQGVSEGAARRQFADFRERLTAPGSEPPTGEDATPSKLTALIGVKRFPMRVKCATLPWHTMIAAMDGGPLKPVSTE